LLIKIYLYIRNEKVFRNSIHLLIVVLLLFLGCAKSARMDERYKPQKNLLEILSDFRRHLDDDTYRFPAAKDITGKNIYKATLIRLENYERLHPGYMEDIVIFSKAKAYEKLHDYDQAIEQYKRLFNTGSGLEEEARKNINVCYEFSNLIKKEKRLREELDYEEKTIPEKLDEFDEILKTWDFLTRKYKGSPYGFLALEQEEMADAAKIDFIVKYRHRIRDGENLVILGYNQLIAKHKESKNIYAHILKFASFYESYSREYATKNDPRSLSFNMEKFNRMANHALDLYGIVASKDGIPEKIEAKGMIKSFYAYVEKVRGKNR